MEDKMVERRYELSNVLRELIGSTNVYFQPPPKTMLRYPCFVYSRSSDYNIRANDKNYHMRPHYQLTYIDPNPDNCIRMKTKILETFQYCSIERSFTSDNLNHDVYNLYY